MHLEQYGNEKSPQTDFSNLALEKTIVDHRHIILILSICGVSPIKTLLICFYNNLCQKRHTASHLQQIFSPNCILETTIFKLLPFLGYMQASLILGPRKT